jgi:type II restriction enzyme
MNEVQHQHQNDLSAGWGAVELPHALERKSECRQGMGLAMAVSAGPTLVCFGDGCDFADDSSILDRVVTIAMFGHLNKECLHNQGPKGTFNRGSFFFRVQEWSEKEMAQVCYSIAEKSVFYYFSKYGDSAFLRE